MPELIDRKFEEFFFIQIAEFFKYISDLRGILQLTINGNNLRLLILGIGLVAIEGFGLLFFGVGVEGDLRADALVGEAGTELWIGLELGLLFFACAVVFVGLFHCGLVSEVISIVFRVYLLFLEFI